MCYMYVYFHMWAYMYITTYVHVCIYVYMYVYIHMWACGDQVDVRGPPPGCSLHCFLRQDLSWNPQLTACLDWLPASPSDPCDPPIPVLWLQMAQLCLTFVQILGITLRCSCLYSKRFGHSATTTVPEISICLTLQDVSMCSYNRR